MWGDTTNGTNHLKNTFDMTYDKIKEIMMSDCPHIWKWWTEEVRVILPSDQLIKKYKEARIQLKVEIESGILTEQRHFAEYELLCLLSGIKEPLTL